MSSAGPSSSTSPSSGDEDTFGKHLVDSPTEHELGSVQVTGAGPWSLLATSLVDGLLRHCLDFLLARTKGYALTARHIGGWVEMSLLRDQKHVPVRERVSRLCNALATFFHLTVVQPSGGNISAILSQWDKVVQSPITFTIESDVEVKPSLQHDRGMGLFTTRKLKTGTRVATYAEAASVYLWGTKGSFLVIGSFCARIFEALLKNAYRYSFEVARADDSLFCKEIWSGCSRNTDFRKTNTLQKEVAKAMFFSPAYATHLNLLLLSRNFPDAGFEDPLTRDDCQFKGPFWDYLLRTDIFPLVCRCLGCVVIPCKRCANALQCPSDNLANFINHANVGKKNTTGEKNNTKYSIDNASLAVYAETTVAVGKIKELLASYGKEHGEEPSLTDTCEFLRKLSGDIKLQLLVLFRAMERSTIFDVDRRWDAALQRALLVETKKRRRLVRKKHPLQNTLILVFHFGEWWPATITKGGKKNYNLQILRTDLSLSQLHHFGDRWKKFELGENITDYMQQGGHSPQTAEAHFSAAVMAKNPWCTLKSACDSDGGTIPEKLSDEQMNKLPNLPHEDLKERSARKRKKRKKSSSGQNPWQNRTWRPSVRLSLYKVRERIAEDVEKPAKECKEEWPIRKQMREISRIFRAEKWDLNGLLGIPLENDPNIRHFEPALETFTAHVPYYYKHEATWMKVTKVEQKGASSILVSVESLTGDLSHFSYDTIESLRNDFESLYDKCEIVLFSERTIPPDLYALLYPNTEHAATEHAETEHAATEGQFDAEAAAAAGAGAIPSMLLGQIEYLQQQIAVLEKTPAPAPTPAPTPAPAPPPTPPPSDEEEASEILMALGKTSTDNPASINTIQFHNLSKKQKWEGATISYAFIKKWHGRGCVLTVVLGKSDRVTLRNGFTVSVSQDIKPRNIESPQWRSAKGINKHLKWRKNNEPFRGRKGPCLLVSQAPERAVRISRTPMNNVYGFRGLLRHRRIGIYITSETRLQYESGTNTHLVPIWKNKSGDRLDKSVRVIGIDLQPSARKPPAKCRRIMI